MKLPYQPCVGKNCAIRSTCQRYLFYEAGLPIGMTILAFDNQNNDCVCFVEEEFKIKMRWNHEKIDDCHYHWRLKPLTLPLARNELDARMIVEAIKQDIEDSEKSGYIIKTETGSKMDSSKHEEFERLKKNRSPEELERDRHIKELQDQNEKQRRIALAKIKECENND
jgi:hypothetical protein